MTQTVGVSLRHRASDSRKGLVFFWRLCQYCPFLGRWQITPFRALAYFAPQNACTCQHRRLRRLSQELLGESEKRILPYTWRCSQQEPLTLGQFDIARLNSDVYFNALTPGLLCAQHCGINWYHTCTQCCTVLQCSGLRAHAVRRPDLFCNLQVCREQSGIMLSPSLL